MNLKVITLKFDPVKEIFDETPLNTFCLKNKVVSSDSHFFSNGNNHYLAYSLNYEPIFHSKRNLTDSQNKVTDELDEKEMIIFEKLREIRKKRTAEDGLPVYAYSKNEDMVQVIKNRCTTMEALKNIKGFGKKKLNGVGKEFIEVMKAFSEENVD